MKKGVLFLICGFATDTATGAGGTLRTFEAADLLRGAVSLSLLPAPSVAVDAFGAATLVAAVLPLPFDALLPLRTVLACSVVDESLGQELLIA
jgi:hypothetical protein